MRSRERLILEWRERAKLIEKDGHLPNTCKECTQRFDEMEMIKKRLGHLADIKTMKVLGR